MEKQFSVGKEKLRQAVLSIDPNKSYPVSYYFTQPGEKIMCNHILPGRDLTENQIHELMIKGLI